MSPSARSEKFTGNARCPLARLALAALVLAVWASVSLAQTAAPQPGGSGALPHLGEGSELTPGAERRLGDRIAISLYRDADTIDDPVLVDYLQGIWQPLLAAARARGELPPELDERFAWQLFLIRDRTLNAFALPGGYLGLHLGMIGSAGSADELAAVLAHELSHVTQRHISRLMTNQSRQTPLLIAAMILGALAASKSSDMASAAVVGGQALAVQGQLNFSRGMEREADRIGFGVMTDAGFQGRGVTALFDKLQQGARLNDSGAFPYLRSHPLHSERIAEAQARLQLAPSAAASANKDSEAEAGKARLLHALMAARARALAAPGVDGLRTLLAEAQRRLAAPTTEPPTSPAGSRDAGVLYAGALAAAQLRDFAAARSLVARLKPLAAVSPRASQTVELLSVEMDLLAGAVPPAAATLDLGRATTRAELLLQGRALLAAGRAKEVSERLQTWVATHPRDAGAWQLLAVAYGNQEQSVRAIRADAEGRAAQLDYPAALDRLKAAQGLMRGNPASADHVEGSIIDTRTRQMELLVKEQALQDKIDR
ncbi:M48 family metalloprotease [Polaromonas sp.]|uniref:M48 family metalloprotease n=1 Tax=Polaromonas sp. TaxID=1869339 RepID=UPI00386217F4